MSPLSYGFQALMINEFKGHTFTQGNITIDGVDFIDSNYGIKYDNMEAFKWGMIPLMLSYGVVFAVIGVLMLNHLKFNKEAKESQRVYLSDKDKRALESRCVFVGVHVCFHLTSLLHCLCHLQTSAIQGHRRSCRSAACIPHMVPAALRCRCDCQQEGRAQATAARH